MNIKNLLLNTTSINSKRAAILAQLDSDRFKPTMIIKSNLVFMLEEPHLFDPSVTINSIREDKDNWDAKYWTKMCVELSNNFSKEQLKHIIDVMSYLRGKSDPKFTPIKQLPKQKTGRHQEVVRHPGYIETKLCNVIRKNYEI